MKNIYAAFLVFLFINSAFSQVAPAIVWQNTIGGSDDDNLTAIQQTADKGYILGGLSISGDSGDKTDTCQGSFDFWIVKADSSGVVEWDNTIGGSNWDQLNTLQQTSDGGYILGGRSESGISGDKTETGIGLYDYWIVKTNAVGAILWQNTIGGTSFDELISIRQTYDGGFILGGSSQSNIAFDKTENCIGGYDYWLVKTDTTGNIQWQNTIGGSNDDRLFCIEQTTDGGFILGGTSLSDMSGDKTENCIGLYDYWLVKTDSAGNIQWQNTIGGSNSDWLNAVSQTDDGGFIIGGRSDSNISGDKTEVSNGGNDYWIIKTDASGNIEWQNTIGGNSDDWLYSIQQTDDGGYFLGGRSASNISGDKTEDSNGGFDYWVLKTDSAGNIQWQNTIGGNGNDALHAAQQTNDHGYILAGPASSNISGDKTENCMGFFDYWIVKLAPDTITGISDFGLPNADLNIFPNPLTSISTITFQNPDKEKYLFTLYDITGRVISPPERCVITYDDKIILEKDNKPPGVYLVVLTSQKTKERMNGKIIIGD